MAPATLNRLNLGPIEPDVLYPLDDFKARTGWGAVALREARKRDLKVQYAGGRGYILGRDFIEWLSQNAKSNYHDR